MEGLKILADNWAILVAMICGIAFVTAMVVKFMSMPTAKQIENVKEWLRYAVIECEKEMNSHTGSAKLRMCYDLAVKQFPWIAIYISFDDFSKWVDDALVWMRNQLESNEAIAKYVGSE